jgi:hypothetical protein
LANDGVHTFAPSSDCKECHPKIYEEFSSSMHANSTPQKDPIHKSVWDLHPKKNKFNRYECGKCHTPAADDLDKMLSKDETAMPMAENETHQAGISCAYCHRIQSIEHHPISNTNIMTKTPKNYFGNLMEHMESPYHGIISKGNEHMKNGNVCIGCHSHKMNKHGLNVCSTNIDNQLDGANCVSCHMPKVDGSVSKLYETKQHTFHGFAGSHFHSDMLEKYVDISLLRQIDNFVVNIDNRSSHALLLHPLRVAVLKVIVHRGSKIEDMKPQIFARVIGKDGKPAMPWAADSEIQNNMIQANEKRAIKYNFELQKGDIVDVTLGWYLVNPKVVKKLNLQNEEVATKFNVFKKQRFEF